MGTIQAESCHAQFVASWPAILRTLGGGDWRDATLDPIMLTDMQSDIASFRIQLRVIGALMMRELHTRYGRENIGFAWFIGEPIVFTFGVVLLWSQTRGVSEHGISVIAFVLTGYTPMVMWRHCFGQAISSLQANGSLLYHRQVTFLDIIIARTLIEIAGSMLAFTLSIIFFAIILGLIPMPAGNYNLMITGWLLYAWFCFATALLVAAVTELSQIAEKFAQIVGYIMIPLCGAFWMVDWLPMWLHKYAVLIPSVSAFELIRSSYFGDTVHVYYDLTTSSAVCSIMTFLGLLTIRKARNHLAVE